MLRAKQTSAMSFLCIMLWLSSILVSAAPGPAGSQVSAPPDSTDDGLSWWGYQGSYVQVNPAPPPAQADVPVPVLSPVQIRVAPAADPDPTLLPLSPAQPLASADTSEVFDAYSDTVICVEDPTGTNQVWLRVSLADEACTCTTSCADPSCTGLGVVVRPWTSVCMSLGMDPRRSVFFGDQFMGPLYPAYPKSPSGRSMSSPLGEPYADDEDFNSWYEDAGACFRVVLHNSTPRTIRLSVQPECSADVTPVRVTRGLTCSQLLHAERSARELAQHELEAAEGPKHDDHEQDQPRGDPDLDCDVDEEHDFTQFDIESALQEDFDPGAEVLSGNSEALYYGADRAKGGVLRESVASFMRQAAEHDDCETVSADVPPQDNNSSQEPINQDPSRDADNVSPQHKNCTQEPILDEVDLDDADVPEYVHNETDVYETRLHRETYGWLYYKQVPFRLQGSGPGQAKKRKIFKQNAGRRYTIKFCPRTNQEELYHVREGNMTKKRKDARSITSVVQARWHNMREVPRHQESLQIVQQLHDANHQGHNVLQARLSQKFFIPNLAAKCLAVSGNNCKVCATHEAVKKKPAGAILTSRRGELVIFDLTKYYCPVRHLMLFSPRSSDWHIRCASALVTHARVLNRTWHIRCATPFLSHTNARLVMRVPGQGRFRVDARRRGPLHQVLVGKGIQK